jgi:surface antigen
MSMRTGLSAVVAAVLLLAGGPAAAQGLGWMKGDTAGFFTDADWQLLEETLTAALNEAVDGEPREWRNERSGAQGKVTPLVSDRRADVTCRRVRIESAAKGTSSSYRYLFCRRGEDRWRLGQPRD